jgi:AraC-like DNA-binding protein
MKQRPVSSLSWPPKALPTCRAQMAGQFPMTVPGCNRSHRHETIALHLHDYAGDFWIGRTHYKLEPGDITFSPHDIENRYELKETGSHLCVHFFPNSAGPRKSGLRLPLHLRLGVRTAAARERFWRVIDYVRQGGADPDSPAGCAASAALQELLLWLYLQSRRGRAPRRESVVEQALVKLRRAVEASLSKPMLIGDLAAGVGLSADYVARLFAKRYGMTLQHYLLMRRIELARHLLLASDLRSSGIGRQVGLPDPQYFNKQFRRVVGQSPTAFRRQQAQASRSHPEPRREKAKKF